MSMLCYTSWYSESRFLMVRNFNYVINVSVRTSKVTHCNTLFFFIKNKLNKNIKAEIARKIRTM